MKKVAILLATLVASVSFAQAPAAKKEEAKNPADKVEAKAPVAAPAAPAKKEEMKLPAKKADAKPADTKSAPAKAEDKKAEAPKK
jgi:hypothetical protein